MNQIGTKTIETERCIMRRIVPSDCEAMYHSWAKFEEVCRYFPFDPFDSIEPYREKVNRWISNYASGSYFQWVIEWKETGELIGVINLGNVNEDCRMADVNYMLAPDYWHRGIMTEVVTAVLNYAFDEIGLNRVQAEVFDGNNASSAVLKKCGMTFEGIERQRYYKHGAFIDTALWSILADDRCHQSPISPNR